jgi:hypothetical protein
MSKTQEKDVKNPFTARIEKLQGDIARIHENYLKVLLLSGNNPLRHDRYQAKVKKVTEKLTMIYIEERCWLEAHK